MNNRKIKLALIGAGSMGTGHLMNIAAMPGIDLSAVCDIVKERADKAAQTYGAKPFYNCDEMFDWGDFEAVLIATPHYDHVTIARKAFSKGFHVLTEKPMAVHPNDASSMIRSWEKSLTPGEERPVLAVMYQQRTLGHWKKIKELISSGELGRLIRVTWIITDWFRTQYYYDNGGWRATWKGEGGGVLMNQCPHQLDLYQWFFGMPEQVSGFASLGKYHNVEVEDEVSATFFHSNGMVGHFITSTGESPGTNRLEIVGEMGKIVFEDGDLTYFRNRKSMLEQLEKAQDGYEKCENWKIELPYEKSSVSPHRILLQNFIQSITDKGTPLCDGYEGVNATILGTAIMHSHFEGRKIDLPFDYSSYEKTLEKLIKESNFEKKNIRETVIADLSGSF